MPASRSLWMILIGTLRRVAGGLQIDESLMQLPIQRDHPAAVLTLAGAIREVQHVADVAVAIEHHSPGHLGDLYRPQSRANGQ
jgi:hypothetical protein